MQPVSSASSIRPGCIPAWPSPRRIYGLNPAKSGLVVVRQVRPEVESVVVGDVVLDVAMQELCMAVHEGEVRSRSTLMEIAAFAAERGTDQVAAVAQNKCHAVAHVGGTSRLYDRRKCLLAIDIGAVRTTRPSGAGEVVVGRGRTQTIATGKCEGDAHLGHVAMPAAQVRSGRQRGNPAGRAAARRAGTVAVLLIHALREQPGIEGGAPEEIVDRK